MKDKDSADSPDISDLMHEIKALREEVRQMREDAKRQEADIIAASICASTATAPGADGTYH